MSFCFTPAKNKMSSGGKNVDKLTDKEEGLSVQFMRRAIELSCHAVKVGDGVPYGCVIVRDNKIIGEGWNHTISQHDPTEHGEVNAIRNTCRALKTTSLEGADLYTNCEPCLMCAFVIQAVGISKIFYGASKDKIFSIIGSPLTAIEEDLKNPTDQRKIPAQRLLSDEAEKALLEGYGFSSNLE